MNYVVAASYKKQFKDGIHTYLFDVYRRKKTNLGEEVKSKELEGRTVWWVPSVQKEKMTVKSS